MNPEFRTNLWVGIISSIVGSILGGLAVLLVQVVIGAMNEAPNLEHISTSVVDVYADVLVKSKSTKPTLIVGYAYCVKRVVKPPPRRGPVGERVPKAVREGVIGAAIPTDDITLDTTCCTVGKWCTAWDTREIDANKHNTLRVRVLDPEWTGAQFEMSLVLFYGDHKNPYRLEIPPFRINVGAK